mgnify:CR=1 FL=1
MCPSFLNDSPAVSNNLTVCANWSFGSYVRSLGGLICLPEVDLLWTMANGGGRGEAGGHGLNTAGPLPQTTNQWLKAILYDAQANMLAEERPGKLLQLVPGRCPAPCVRAAAAVGI